MFFWATRRALGETGSRHASKVILSRLSTVRVAFSPALEQFMRYILLIIQYFYYRSLSMKWSLWEMVSGMVHGNFMYLFA
jgi:hypothetical protein